MKLNEMKGWERISVQMYLMQMIKLLYDSVCSKKFKIKITTKLDVVKTNG